MDVCGNCGKRRLIRNKSEYSVLGVSLGKFDSLVCQVCGEIVFDGHAMAEIQKKAKTAGIWGIAARTRIGTSGNALDVKLPKSLVDFFKLRKGQEVVIEPIDESRFQVMLESS